MSMGNGESEILSEAQHVLTEGRPSLAIEFAQSQGHKLGKKTPLPFAKSSLPAPQPNHFCHFSQNLGPENSRRAQKLPSVLGKFCDTRRQ